MSGQAAEDESYDATLRKASAKQVARAVDRLGDDDRELLNLLYRHRLTPSQAGLELGMTEAAIRAQLSAALRKVGLLLTDSSDSRQVTG